jgi:hypothetical protein
MWSGPGGFQEQHEQNLRLQEWQQQAQPGESPPSHIWIPPAPSTGILALFVLTSLACLVLALVLL